MAWPHLVRLALLATLAGAALSVLSTGAQSQRLPVAPEVMASYKLTATFEATLFVGWSHEEGDDSTPCSPWARESGTSRVVARGVKGKPLRGSITVYKPGTTSIRVGRKRISVPWSTLQALGGATGTVTRTVTQTSGVTPGCAPGSTVRPKRFEPTECGERRFASRTAALIATNRAFDRTLDPGNANPSGVGPEQLARLTNPSIDFHVGPRRDPFRLCDVGPVFAKRFPVDVGLDLEEGNGGVSTFANLVMRGQRAVLIHKYGGRCSSAGSPRECSFSLHLEVRITRTS